MFVRRWHCIKRRGYFSDVFGRSGIRQQSEGFLKLHARLEGAIGREGNRRKGRGLLRAESIEGRFANNGFVEGSLPNLLNHELETLFVLFFQSSWVFLLHFLPLLDLVFHPSKLLSAFEVAVLEGVQQVGLQPVSLHRAFHLLGFLLQLGCNLFVLNHGNGGLVLLQQIDLYHQLLFGLGASESNEVNALLL